MPAAEGDAARRQVRRLLSLRRFGAGVFLRSEGIRRVLLMPRVRELRRWIDTDADDLSGMNLGAHVLPRQAALRLGKEADRPHGFEHLLPQRKTERGAQLQVGKQDGPFGCEPGALHGRRMLEREEDQRVIDALLALQVIDQPGGHGAQATYPFELVGTRARRSGYTGRELRKRVAVVRLTDGKAPDEHAAHPI